MKSSYSDQIVSSPLVWISAALAVGILLGWNISLSVYGWFLLSFLALLTALALLRLRPNLIFGLLMLPGFVFLGAARYQMAQTTITSADISYYNNMEKRIYVTGIVDEAPDMQDTTINLKIKVTALDAGAGDIPVRGNLLVTLTDEYTVQYGNLVRVRGFVKTPQETEEFSYRDYLAMQGIHSSLRTNKITILPGTKTDPFRAWVYQLQNSLNKRITKMFPNPEASLLAGILLGNDKSIPSDVEDAFKNTGTAHIIAISGFNIAIISAIFVYLFSRLLGKTWGIVPALLGIVFYTLLVGASPSVVRAAIMGILSMIGGLFGRRNLALNALSIAAGLMALLNPMVLWDIGFQLSFSATLGLIFFAQPLQDFFTNLLSKKFPREQINKFIRPFSDYFLLTFAAQVATLPVSIYHFGRFSLSALITNPLVLPAQPALMVLGGIALLLNKLYAPLGQLIAWMAWPFATYTIRVVEFFSNIPGGVLTLGEFGLLAAVFYTIILFGSPVIWPKIQKYATPTLVLSVLAIFSVLIWRAIYNLPDGRLHIRFMNVGSADGVLITTPSGRNILINGGKSPSVLSNALGRYISPFNQTIDMLIVASTQENQVAALPRVLDQYPPALALWAGNAQASFSSQRLKKWLNTNHIPVDHAEDHNSYDLGDGVKLKILAVSPRGAIISVENGEFKTILPVGANRDTFDALENGNGVGSITALLLSESGYAPANPTEWLENLNPQVIILSVAPADPEGLPSTDVIESLKNKTILRTDENGWIELASDGKNFWITSENK